MIVSTCTGAASLDTSSSNDSEFEDEPRMYGMRICTCAYFFVSLIHRPSLSIKCIA